MSWERGLDVFEELLLDHEPACNAGNWQWLSCTAFFSQYFRCYSPISFGKKWDPDGTFIRKWVPELASLDKKYIYEPWKAPEAEFTPMFDFDERRRVVSLAPFPASAVLLAFVFARLECLEKICATPKSCRTSERTRQL